MCLCAEVNWGLCFWGRRGAASVPPRSFHFTTEGLICSPQATKTNDDLIREISELIERSTFGGLGDEKTQTKESWSSNSFLPSVLKNNMTLSIHKSIDYYCIFT